ncbi:MAG: hypothetical protein ABH871_03010 [Pseudomonadota bacterium]
MKHILIIMIFLLICSCSKTQQSRTDTGDGSVSDSGAGLSIESGDFVSDKIGSFISDMPSAGSEAYVLLDDCDAESFRTLITNLWKGDTEAMQDAASEVGYMLLRYNDDENEDASYLLLVEKEREGQRHQGLFAFNPEGSLNLVIEAPHPKYETSTGTIAAHIFRETDSKALFIAGAHRCSDSESSLCSGITSVCSASNKDEPFRISDVAHDVCNLFHAAHMALNDVDEKPTFLQIHGKKDNAPEAVFSDGSMRMATTSSSVLLAKKLMNRIATKSGYDGVASCQSDESGGIQKGTVLCATTNVQGRYTNGVSKSRCCNDAPDDQAITGRFIHIEMSPDLRDAEDDNNDKIGPDDLIAAINETWL